VLSGGRDQSAGSGGKQGDENCVDHILNLVIYPMLYGFVGACTVFIYQRANSMLGTKSYSGRQS
jgi:cobalamin biosynthesis protein CobD/CbiB